MEASEVALIVGYWVLGGFLALLALVAFAANPGRAANRALGALLLLDAASTVAFQYSRGAPTDELARHYSAIAHWYFLPITALMLYTALRLTGPSERAWISRAILAVAVLVTAMGYLALLLSGSLADAPVRHSETTGFRSVFLPPEVTWLKLPHDVLTTLTPLAIIFLAAHRAASVTVAPFERRQAALVGLAFVFYTGASLTNAALVLLRATLKLEPLSWADRPMLFPTAALAPLLPWAVARLASGFPPGRARRALVVAASVPLVMGLVAPLGLTDAFAGVGLGNGRILQVAAYAGTLALALVRYDLAGLSPAYRRGLLAASRASLVTALAALPAVIVLVALGGSSTALLVIGAVVVGAVAVSPAPVRGLARRLAETLFVTRDDPAAVAERARLYATALEGRAGEAAIPARIEDVRRQLDLSPREQEIVADALARRHAPGVAVDPRLPVFLGRFVIERELGRGGAGVALLATDPVSGRRVVLKRYHTAGDRRRARKEAEALSRAASPRVARLLEIDDAGGELILVMDYAPGGSLQTLLDAGGPLPPARAVSYALDVLRGLEDLHRAGVVHRDLKPGNVLLDADGRALIADFGAAGFESEDAPADATVTVARVVGSYATISPEVLAGREATPAADIYAAGALLYRLLTRSDYVLLAGKSQARARDAILHDAPRLDHPLVPPALAPVLARALAKDPAQRFPSARAMRDALAAASG